MDNLIWIALAREAAIAAEHLGQGATILGKANYAHHAHYGQAFFSLSTGIERGAKLALAVDRALENDGEFPSQQVLRSYGHNLSELLAAVDGIAEKRGLAESERQPNSPIHDGIVEVLTDFASNITRYFNLDFVMNNVHAKAKGDPINSWHQMVMVPILQKHLKSERRDKIEDNARQVSELMQPFAHVSHTAESSDHLGSMYEASMQTGLNEVSKPYERMYVLQYARFYCHVMNELTHAAYKSRMDIIPDLSEFFGIYNNQDSYFRSRKTWSIYNP